MMLNPDDLFSPRSAIRGNRYDRLFGRDDLIVEFTNETAAESVCPVFFGERGVGKTSVAAQVFDILNDSHPKFKLSEIRPFGTSRAFKCVWIECQPEMRDVKGLLAKLLSPIKSKNSFSSVFSNYYRTESFLQRIVDQYQISYNLFGADFKLKSSSKPQEKEIDTVIQKISSDSQQVRGLFDFLLAEIKNKDPELDIIIFIDEVDRLPEKVGLGDLLKTSSDARFVLIGVADNMQDLVTDHPSVIRKVSSCEVPSLSDAEVSAIFGRANRISENTIIYSNEFLDKALEFSGGFPWMAQRIGYDATVSCFRRTNNEAVSVVDEQDFEMSFAKLTNDILAASKLSFSLSQEIDSEIKIEILGFLSSQRNWVYEDDIIEFIHVNRKKFYVGAVQELESSALIKTRQNFLKFSDSQVRLLVLKHLKSHHSFIFDRLLSHSHRT